MQRRVLCLLRRRQRQPGGGSPATPSPGKEPRGKNRSRHGVKKQQKPEQSSYRQLRYAALNATAGEADASTPLPTAALARGAIPAATAINGGRPDARANGYPTYRRGSGEGYRNNLHSDHGAQIRMTSVPWPGAIAGCGWRNMMCMLAANVIDTSAQGSRETRVFSTWTPYWPQPTAGDVTPANETLSGYGNLVGGLWTGTASRGDALPAIGTAFAGAMARAISAAPRAQEGSASVNVKREPVNAASPAVDVSDAAIVTGAQINAALPAAGPSATASPFGVAVTPCVTGAINASVTPARRLPPDL